MIPIGESSSIEEIAQNIMSHIQTYASQASLSNEDQCELYDFIITNCMTMVETLEGDSNENS